MSSVDITVYYSKTVLLSLKGKSFKDCCEIVFSSDLFGEQQPLKIVFNGTNKVLYADRNLFNDFLNESLSMFDLIQATECEELYRNKTEVITEDGFHIEPGYLWKLKGQCVYMIDDDNFIESHLDLKAFEVAC